MIINRFVRLKLLLLFALLQCVAPLAHAHVSGNNTDQTLHIELHDSAGFSAGFIDHHHDTETTQLSVDEHHSAVVSMPPEFRSSLLLIEQPDGPIQHGNVVPHVHSAVAVADYQQQILSSFPFQHPCSQAPPVQYS